MKNIITIIGLFVLSSACSSGNPNEFADFYVIDVSKEQTFIDSTSALLGKVSSHQTMTFSVEGELDSGAVISLYSFPDDKMFRKIDLVKGEHSIVKKYGKISHINMMYDYYNGDTLLIRYIPKGATKGHLKISTNIH